MTPDRTATIAALDTRLRWLSSWMIHNANHLRDSRDGLKVGGHQASCASITPGTGSPPPRPRVTITLC